MPGVGRSPPNTPDPRLDVSHRSLIDLDSAMEQRRSEQLAAPFAESAARDSSHNSEDGVSAVWKHPLPPFMAEAPDIWFLLIEAEFSVAKVRSDDTKYLAVLRALDGNTMRQLTDVIRNPPLQDKYNNIKTAILSRITESRSRQVDKLLKDLTLGERKPSQLLREMKDLARGEIGPEILHQLWLERLPVHIRPHLLTSTNLGLEAVAEMADRLIDVFSSSYVMAAAHTPPSSTNRDSLERRLDDMQSLLLTCMEEIKELRLQRTHVSQNGNTHMSRNRSSTPSRNRSSTPGRAHADLCHYHLRFGKKALKCDKNCMLFATFNRQAEN